MNNVLLYCRTKATSPIAEQSVCILAEQLQHNGHQVDISHSLNIPRLILNSYQTVHLVIENLPLTTNEAIHFGLCKALGKTTIISILNSDRNLKKAFINFIQPDALSVSQTNHLKHYRSITCNKFVLPAFPKSEITARKSQYNHEAFLIPLQSKLDEVFPITLKDSVYFDGRKLLKSFTSLELRKKWTELQSQRKISDNFHLVLSENKLNELLQEQSLCVVLANPVISHTEFTKWLNITLNHQNLIVLNDYQATGFSTHWTSGHNCMVIPQHQWIKNLGHLEFEHDLVASTYKPNELFQSTVNELSRLYSKLLQQKTTLLTSRSAKL
jgi:hypothetical protein